MSIYLHVDGLFSKWGFNDGDEPDALLDYCDENDLPYPDDWHDRLRRMVREVLLPALNVEIETYDIETIHNPIRAAKVDGVDVPDDVIYGRADFPAAHSIVPQFVEIPFAVALSDRFATDPRATAREDGGEGRG